jgi:hypothetical protein
LSAAASGKSDAAVCFQGFSHRLLRHESDWQAVRLPYNGYYHRA